MALVGRKVSEFFFFGKLAQRKFWRWAAPVALVGSKVSEFFSAETILAEFLLLGGTSGTGCKESFPTLNPCVGCVRVYLLVLGYFFGSSKLAIKWLLHPPSPPPLKNATELCMQSM